MRGRAIIRGFRKSPSWSALLKYSYDSNADDDLTKDIEKQVHITRNMREWSVEQEIKIQASYAYDDGFSIGVSQGAHDKAVETARKMMEKNMSSEDICELTGLSLNEIKRIAVSN